MGVFISQKSANDPDQGFCLFVCLFLLEIQLLNIYQHTTGVDGRLPDEGEWGSIPGRRGCMNKGTTMRGAQGWGETSSSAVLLDHEGAGVADGEGGRAGPVAGLCGHPVELGLSPVGDEKVFRSFK